MKQDHLAKLNGSLFALTYALKAVIHSNPNKSVALHEASRRLDLLTDLLSKDAAAVEGVKVVRNILTQEENQGDEDAIRNVH